MTMNDDIFNEFMKKRSLLPTKKGGCPILDGKLFKDFLTNNPNEHQFSLMFNGSIPSAEAWYALWVTSSKY